MADRSGKPRYKSMKKRLVRINMAVSTTGTSTAPVSLTGSDISETSIEGRKPVKLQFKKLILWQRFKRDRESTVPKMKACFYRMIEILNV